MGPSRLRLYNVVMDCEDALLLARFWADALGWQIRSRDPGWATIADPEGPERRMGFHPVPESKAGKNRLHVDLLPEEGVPRTEERRRLESLGASLVQTVYQADLVAHDVMADPEGNEFCLLEPYPEYFE